MKGFSAACLLLAGGFVAVASADPLQADFDGYCRKFNKKYNSEEYKVRFQSYKNTRLAMDEHYRNGNSWHVGINEMSDWSDEEFRALLGYKHVNISAYGFKPPSAFKYDPSLSTRHSVDWRNHGVLTAVKNQGHCGSCWSFSAAETLESQYAMATGHLEVLSEQNILDCTPNPNECGGTGGCMGATAELAFAMMELQGGLGSEWTYPYQSYFGKNYKCRFEANGGRNTATVTQYVKLPENGFSETVQAVGTVGPISVSVDASSWGLYSGGVFDGCNQTNPDINHAVQLVGYGTDPDAGDYWLVRNSWGTSWGENGYIRLKKNSKADTRCGLDITPLDGTGCMNGPSNQTVCGTCGILFDNSYPIVSS